MIILLVIILAFILGYMFGDDEADVWWSVG